jgi:hypothetical protein
MCSKDRHLNIGMLVLGYSRADMFEKAVRSLVHLGLPEYTPCYGVVDGAREASGQAFEANLAVQERGRMLLNEGILSNLIIRPHNLGTMQNVFTSVTEVLDHHEFVFVLEDDLIVLPLAKGIIQLMVPHLGGKVRAFGIYCNKSYTDTVFFSQRFGSQAWGTSRSSWQEFNIKRLLSLDLTAELRRDLRNNVGSDIISDFKNFQADKLDSWAVPWNVHNLLEGGVMVYTPASYIQNNSHFKGAERTHGIKFEYKIADVPLTNLNYKKPEINQAYLRHFSVMARLKRRFWAEYVKWFGR